jgi:hypothetical protein
MVGSGYGARALAKNSNLELSEQSGQRREGRGNDLTE